MRSFVFLFLCILLVQCSSNSTPEQTDHIQILDEIPEHILEVENLTIFPGDSETRYIIELTPEQTFGEEGEPYLTNVMGAAVDDKQRVIILNANTNYEHSLYVYNTDGTYHTQIGGRGRGPGEYGFVFDIFEAKAGKVFIRDITNERINIYSTEGYNFDRSMRIENLAVRNHIAVKGMRLGLTFARNDGNHLVHFYDRELNIGFSMDKYLFMDANGNALVSDPLIFPSSVSIKVPSKQRIPSLGLTFMGQTLIAMTSEDALYSVWTTDFLLKRYDATGEYESAIYYPIRGVPFNLNEYAQTEPFGYNQQDIEEGVANVGIELPESNPVLSGLLVDDENRIWAAVPMDQKRQMFEWWILNETGELLAKLQRSSNLKIFDIKNGYLYTKEIDEETDAEYVVKYRIEFREAE